MTGPPGRNGRGGHEGRLTKTPAAAKHRESVSKATAVGSDGGAP
jgi:hypothetical protein